MVYGIRILEASKEEFASRQSEARQLMMRFLKRTGVNELSLSTGNFVSSKRYLWTDAFAVCNLLGLNENKLAQLLIFHVHHVLGKHRIDDKRKGWLSGLSEKEGEEHPTIAGLRIGKKLPERMKNEPFDERLEWDRDGQYFHYLTKWMHALDQATSYIKLPHFNQWALELAAVAHRSFTYHYPQGDYNQRLRMYWKMSIDLTYPLVLTQGQHDPLDGYITYRQLSSTAKVLSNQLSNTSDLVNECTQLESIINQGNWETVDPLGIGSLLIDAFRIYQLMHRGVNLYFMGGNLLEELLRDAINGLEIYQKQQEFHKSAEHRLAFRELGLCIGLHAIRLMDVTEKGDLNFSIHDICGELIELIKKKYYAIGDEIEIFWRDEHHRQGRLWKEHQDINDVMLATCLVPRGFLILPDGLNK